MTSSLAALMHANLMEVFGERDPEKRAEAMKRTYTETVVFLDPDEVVTGHAALSAKAQKILDEAPGFVFAPDGPIYENHDMGFLAWQFGPEGAAPVVRGFDACFLDGDLLGKVYTVLTS
jgi:hypothetical protein